MSNKDDLRVTKTYKVLQESMFLLLNQRNFNAITVNALCSEALISRATFYIHFRDKYDLLKHFMAEVRKNIIKDVCKYEKLSTEINEFVSSNKKMIKNILKDANSETLMIVKEFMSDIVDMGVKREKQNNGTSNRISFNNFLVGGIINHLTWMVENNFPPEITVMDAYIYEMLQSLTIWDAEQERKKNAR